jgi:hypothetical protein
MSTRINTPPSTVFATDALQQLQRLLAATPRLPARVARYLQSDNWHERSFALRLLSRLGSAAIPVLAHVLTCAGDPMDREDAAFFLGWVARAAAPTHAQAPARAGDALAAAALSRALADERHAGVRSAIHRSLEALAGAPHPPIAPATP